MALAQQFFGCRALLSRLPTPILDLSLAPETALFVEGMPRNLGWLVSGARREAEAGGGGLDGAGVAALVERLGHLHAMKRQLWYAGYERNMVHELATTTE